MTAMKMHLRVVTIYGQTLRVVSLRPDAKVRFSTNYFHDTWHILADHHGAVMFGRLLWGLAFQRQPGTLLMIDAPQLTTTPFESDAPDPIIVVPAGLTHVDVDTLRALRLRLRRAPMSPTTIRWHTFGMPAAIEAPRCYGYRPTDRLHERELIARRGGYLCFTAPPALLREYGVDICQMNGRGASYYPMVDAKHARHGHHDGEFQVISGFDTKVSAARTARAAIAPDRRDKLADDELRWAVHAQAARDERRLRDARRR